jgi:hypothetical protein
MTHKDPEAIEAARKCYCEWCRKELATDVAHIRAKGMGGGKRLDVKWNLCSLCRKCHLENHAGRSPTSIDLFRIVARREGFDNWEEVQWLVDALLRIEKDSDAARIMKILLRTRSLVRLM